MLAGLKAITESVGYVCLPQMSSVNTSGAQHFQAVETKGAQQVIFK